MLVSAGLDTTASPMERVNATHRRIAGGRHCRRRAVLRPHVGDRSGGTHRPHCRLRTGFIAPQSVDRRSVAAWPLRDTRVQQPRRHPRPQALGACQGSRCATRMVVMLHGCTQSADDSAAGTQTSRLADAHGLPVRLPALQSPLEPHPQALDEVERAPHAAASPRGLTDIGPPDWRQARLESHPSMRRWPERVTAIAGACENGGPTTGQPRRPVAARASRASIAGTRPTRPARS